MNPKKTMNYIEKAIKLAIEGGYSRYPMPMSMENLNKTGRPPADFKTTYNWEVICLDKNFWVALGKGLGNKDVMRCDKYNPNYGKPGEMGCDSDLCEYVGYKDPKKMFDNFMEGNWEGHSPESYFKELLKDEK